MKTYCWRCPTCGHREELSWGQEYGYPVCRGPQEEVTHASTICVRDYKAEAVNVQAVKI